MSKAQNIAGSVLLITAVFSTLNFARTYSCTPLSGPDSTKQIDENSMELYWSHIVWDTSYRSPLTDSLDAIFQSFSHVGIIELSSSCFYSEVTGTSCSIRGKLKEMLKGENHEPEIYLAWQQAHFGGGYEWFGGRTILAYSDSIPFKKIQLPLPCGTLPGGFLVEKDSIMNPSLAYGFHEPVSNYRRFAVKVSVPSVSKQNARFYWKHDLLGRQSRQLNSLSYQGASKARKRFSH